MNNGRLFSDSSNNRQLRIARRLSSLQRIPSRACPRTSVPFNLKTSAPALPSSAATTLRRRRSSSTLPTGPPPLGEPAITNTTSGQAGYAPADVQAMLDQTFAIATQGRPANASATTDPEWPACLACAVVDRVRAGLSTERSGICADCFSRYCWDPASGSIAQQPVPTTTAQSSSLQLVPFLYSRAWIVLLASIPLLLML